MRRGSRDGTKARRTRGSGGVHGHVSHERAGSSPHALAGHLVDVGVGGDVGEVERPHPAQAAG